MCREVSTPHFRTPRNSLANPSIQFSTPSAAPDTLSVDLATPRPEFATLSINLSILSSVRAKPSFKFREPDQGPRDAELRVRGPERRFLAAERLIISYLRCFLVGLFNVNEKTFSSSNVVAVKQPAQKTNMKKIIISGLLFLGVGVATSQAGVSFGISLDDSHHHHRNRERVIVVPQQHHAPVAVYTQSESGYRNYGNNGYNGYNSGYGQSRFERHEELHHNLEHQHEQYHHDAQHRSGW